jgi:hypothetical protein
MSNLLHCQVINLSLLCHNDIISLIDDYCSQMRVGWFPIPREVGHHCIIGMLNFLEKLTHPDIVYVVHQCTQFASNPRESHANAVKYMCCRYRLRTKEDAIILQLDVSKSFEVHVDFDFAGCNWAKEDATDNPSTAKSQTG